MREIARWIALVLFSLLGLYFLMWAYQSASYSVPAEPFMAEIYKTRAILLLPMSILHFAVGILFFVSLKPKGE